MRSNPTLARFAASLVSMSQSHGAPGSVLGAGTVIRWPELSKNLPQPIRLMLIGGLLVERCDGPVKTLACWRFESLAGFSDDGFRGGGAEPGLHDIVT